MKYFVHNIYGDVNELILSAPNDIECIPRGWTNEEEQILATRLSVAELSGISCLPTLLEWIPEYNIWIETRVADLPQPWDWITILDTHNKNIDNLVYLLNNPL